MHTQDYVSCHSPTSKRLYEQYNTQIQTTSECECSISIDGQALDIYYFNQLTYCVAKASLDESIICCIYFVQIHNSRALPISFTAILTTSTKRVHLVRTRLTLFIFSLVLSLPFPFPSPDLNPLACLLRPPPFLYLSPSSHLRYMTSPFPSVRIPRMILDYLSTPSVIL